MPNVSQEATVVIYNGGYIRDGRSIRIHSNDSGGLGFLNSMTLIGDDGAQGTANFDNLLTDLLDKTDLRAGASKVRLTLSLIEE